MVRKLARFIFGLIAILSILAMGSAFIVLFYNLAKIVQDVNDALNIR